MAVTRPARVFVSEYLCGGAWPSGPLPVSLAREGWSMLSAVVADLRALPGVVVETTCDHRLQSRSLDGVTVHWVSSPDEERRVFHRLCTECDGTLVIAPEFETILETRCANVEHAGGRLLGPSSQAVALCADKLVLARHLTDRGIPTIPTWPIDWDKSSPTSGAGISAGIPCVVKPRDGAGSQSTFLVSSQSNWDELKVARTAHPLLNQAIVQPYIRGKALSCAVLCDPEHQVCEALPVAEQRLSEDGRFEYLGGAIPWGDARTAEIERLAVAACQSVPGLRGYVGVDLIVPENAGVPQVVEINPRVTTSYLGYRRLLAEGGGGSRGVTASSWRLAERMVFPERKTVWQFHPSARVEFEPVSFSGRQEG